MGCQHSKLGQHQTPMIESKPTSHKYGIECTTHIEGDNPIVMESEETPQEIRKIRAELFPTDSILTMASSAETGSTEHSRSFGSYSLPSQDSTQRDVGENTGCRFMDYGRNDDNDKDNDADESQKQQPIPKMKPSGRRASFERSGYHYPSALYEEIKTQKHFVPTTSTGDRNIATRGSLRQQSRQSLPSLRSSATTSVSGEGSEDNEGSFSFVSSPGGNSTFGGDFTVDESQMTDMFPQFEALVDTMALSLEPQDNDRVTRFGTKSSVLSLGALVDKLTEMDDGGDFLEDSDDDDDEEEDSTLQRVEEENEDNASGISSSIEGGPAVAPTFNSRARAPPMNAARSRGRRYSAPPMLEQNHSSEMLANMKTLALMADVKDILTPSSNNNSNDADADQKADVGLSYCSGNNKTLKFHRSMSVASSSASVCSELQWM